MSNIFISKQSRIRYRLLPLLLALILSLSAIPVWADDSVDRGQLTDPPAIEDLIDLPTGIVEYEEPPVLKSPSANALTDTPDGTDEDVLAELRSYADGEIVAEGIEINCSYVVFRNTDGADTYTIVLGGGESNRTTVIFNGSNISNSYKNNVTRAIVIDGIETVGQYSFSSCSSLLSVKLPDSLREIKEGAFKYCDCLNDVSSLSGNQLAVSSIGDEAFFRCGCNGAAIATNISALDGFAIARAAYSYRWLPPGTTNSSAARVRQVRAVYDRIREILTELDVQGRSDIDKIFRIYEWVTDNVEYAYDALEEDASDELYRYSASAHRALFEHKAICSGYTDLTRFMLNEAGIDCVEMTGGEHAWLIVRLDGKWYAIDPTWDKTTNKSAQGYRYFLRSQAAFEDHTWESYTGMIPEVYPVSMEDYGRGIKSGDYEFEIFGEDHVAITGYTGSTGVTSLVLPATFDFNGQQLKVKEVGINSFRKLTKLKSLEIPEGYTAIHSEAFTNSGKLSSINLPSTIKSIGSMVFRFEADISPSIVFNGTLEQIGAIYVPEYTLCELFNYPIKCSDGTFRHPKNLRFAKVTVSPRIFTYNGKVHNPKVTVTALDGTVLKESVDYELEIYSDEDDVVQDVDSYYIEVFSQEGEYFGFADVQTEIIVRPQATTVKKLTPRTKSMTVYWTKKSGQVGGYQIQYALNKSFTKGRKTVTVRGRNNASKLIRNLKKGKTYYVRVRTYKYAVTYDGNLYSTWSKAKSVKIRK